MKNSKKILSFALSLIMVYSLLICPGGMIPSSAETIVHVATDKSPDTYKNQPGVILCPNGSIPSTLIEQIKTGHITCYFAPGEYWVEGPTRELTIGSFTNIYGETPVVLPKDRKQMLYPDASKQAVFVTRTFLLSKTAATENQIAHITTKSGATNVTIQDIEFSGYVRIKFEENSTNCTMRNVLVHNYHGTYPNGTWCNMGYADATGSIWISKSNKTINLENCSVQCSSHHGICCQGDGISRNINITNCRVLHAGCGQLRGNTPEDIAESKSAMPEREGYGYMDWSVGFDLCENSNVENVTVTDCFAYDSWKVGFYTEPKGTGGDVTNLSLIRCTAIDSGQRAVLHTEPIKETICKETEGCNFFFQGGYFEDCISINGEKSGWLFMGSRPYANPYRDGNSKMVNCGDRGSPISIVSEMYQTGGINSTGFKSIYPQKYAFMLFGGGGFHLKNTTILTSRTDHPPIRLGNMRRQQFLESRDPANRAASAIGGKYDSYCIDMIECSLNGQIYGYSSAPFVEIKQGSRWNSSGDPLKAGAQLASSMDTMNPDDYITLNGLPINVEGITLDKTQTNVDLGKTLQLNSTIAPEDATNKSVVWSSGDENIATVSSSGIVTAKALGKTTITAKTVNGEKTATCEVTVVQPVTSIKLNKAAYTLNVGKTFSLTATVNPLNAADKTIRWSSSNTKIAIVSAAGLVTAKYRGTCRITATSNDGLVKANCALTVVQPVKGVTLNKKSLTIKKGRTYTLKATISPSNANNKKVTWKSGNKAIATVSSGGKITAKKKGTTYIYVTTVDGKKTARCKVVVT